MSFLTHVCTPAEKKSPVRFNHKQGFITAVVLNKSTVQKNGFGPHE